MHHIYGNVTENGVFVSDMVDVNHDTVYPLEDPYFVRFTSWFESESMEDGAKPAFAVFSKVKPYEAVYAKKLNGTFADYFDSLSVKDTLNKNFDENFEELKKEFSEFLKNLTPIHTVAFMVLSGMDWHDTKETTEFLKQNGSYDIKNPNEVIAKHLFETINRMEISVDSKVNSLRGKITEEEILSHIRNNEDFDLFSEGEAGADISFHYNANEKEYTCYIGWHSDHGYYLEDDIPPYHVGYVVVENFLVPSKGIPSVQRFYSTPYETQEEAEKAFDEFELRSGYRSIKELLVLNLGKKLDSNWFNNNMYVINNYGIMSQKDKKFSIYADKQIRIIEDFQKEKTVWERLYDDHNGDRTTYEMESLWDFNGYQDLSVEELHRINMERIRWNLEKMWHNDVDDMLESQDYVAPYVKEFLGNPKYIARISGSNFGMTSKIDDWDESIDLYRNDFEFVSPNEDNYQEKLHTFYDKEKALKWVNANILPTGKLPWD